jgi:hypothetical protein
LYFDHHVKLSPRYPILQLNANVLGLKGSANYLTNGTDDLPFTPISLHILMSLHDFFPGKYFVDIDLESSVVEFLEVCFKGIAETALGLGVSMIRYDLV